MKVLLATALCALFCLFAGSALAGSVPEYDIKSLCAKQGGDSPLIEEQCLEDQNEAKKRIKAAKYSDATLADCRKSTEELDSSYMLLEQCLKDAAFDYQLQ